MIVAGQRQHAAVGRGAGRVAVLQRVAAAVDPRPLAVPDRKDAVIFGAGEQPDLLAAPHRGGGQLLVDRRLKLYMVALDKAARAPQRLVERAERRAAIAGNKAAGVEPRRRIALALQQRQAHQRLRAGQIDPAFFKNVLVVERDCRQRVGHRGLPQFLLGA